MYRFEKANERAASEICLREFVFCANVNYIFSWNKQWNKPHYRLVFNIIKSSICVRKWLIYIFGPNYSFVLATCVLLHRYLFSFFCRQKFLLSRHLLHWDTQLNLAFVLEIQRYTIYFEQFFRHLNYGVFVTWLTFAQTQTHTFAPVLVHSNRQLISSPTSINWILC